MTQLPQPLGRTLLPWSYFLLLGVSNALLAYTQWPLTAKLFIGFYGLCVPSFFLAWAFKRGGAGEWPRAGPFSTASLLPPPAAAGWGVLLAALLFTRFFRIGSNPLWPIKDVGHFGILGLSLSQNWDGRLLWGECQSEPLYLWLLGLYFKAVPASSLSTRLFPALLSVVTLGLAYGAARCFFSRSFSFLAVSFFAAGFADWLFSRTGIGPVALWPLLFLALGLLAKSFQPGAPWWTEAALGACAGMGFYSYASWPVVFLSIALAIAWKALRPPKKPLPLFLFLFFSLGTAFPLLRTHLAVGGLRHFQEEFLQLPLTRSIPDYFNLLFWDGMGSHPDGPSWGGVFNPLESGLIGLGFLRLALSPQRNLSLWFFSAFVLFLLPGILSNTLGMCHVIQVFPLLLIPLLAGLEELLLALPLPRRWPAAGMLLLASFGLNAYHWWGPSQDWKNLPPGQSDWISGEYARAYGLLEEQQREGPGWLFTEFHLDPFNKTLELFSYPFDALQNPKWRRTRPLWAALLVNKYYLPFLQKRFPQSRWDILKRDPLPNNLNLALGLIPVDPSAKVDWGRWGTADKALGDLDLEMKKAGPGTRQGVFQSELRGQYPLFSGDPFLLSVYWEKMAWFDAVRGDGAACERDYQNALEQGYPAAHLYYDLSMAQRADGHLREAGENLGKAEEQRRSPP